MTTLQGNTSALTVDQENDFFSIFGNDPVFEEVVELEVTDAVIGAVQASVETEMEDLTEEGFFSVFGNDPTFETVVEVPMTDSVVGVKESVVVEDMTATQLVEYFEQELIQVVNVASNDYNTALMQYDSVKQLLRDKVLDLAVNYKWSYIVKKVDCIVVTVGQQLKYIAEQEYIHVKTEEVYSLLELQNMARKSYVQLNIEESFAEWFDAMIVDYEVIKGKQLVR